MYHIPQQNQYQTSQHSHHNPMYNTNIPSHLYYPTNSPAMDLKYHLNAAQNRQQSSNKNQYSFGYEYGKNMHSESETKSYEMSKYSKNNKISVDNLYSFNSVDSVYTNNSLPINPSINNQTNIKNNLNACKSYVRKQQIKIDSHINPCHNKILFPILKNSTKSRPNSDSKYTYYQSINTNVSTINTNLNQNQQQFTNSYGYQRRAQSENKNNQSLNNGQATINMNYLHSNINNINNSGNDRYTNKSPYKPPNYNTYHLHNNRRTVNQSPPPSSYHNSNGHIYTPYQQYIDLENLKNIQTAPHSNQRQQYSYHEHATSPQPSKHMDIYNYIEQREKKDLQFYHKCFQHIMIQNSCLTKQILIKEMQLSRLKNQLNRVREQNMNKINNNIDVDTFGNMDVILSVPSQDEEMSEVEMKMKVDNNVSNKEFSYSRESIDNNSRGVKRDNGQDMSLKDINQLIKDIEIEENKLKLLNQISPIKQQKNQYDDYVLEKQDNPLQLMPDSAHKLQGLEYTRLDRLRMKKGFIKKSNQNQNSNINS